MDVTEKVLEVMRTAGEPLNAGKIAELGGLDRKDVDKAMTKLKKELKNTEDGIEKIFKNAKDFLPLLGTSIFHISIIYHYLFTSSILLLLDFLAQLDQDIIHSRHQYSLYKFFAFHILH